jgi:hypothetical protein
LPAEVLKLLAAQPEQPLLATQVPPNPAAQTQDVCTVRPLVVLPTEQAVQAPLPAVDLKVFAKQPVQPEFVPLTQVPP